MTGISAFVVSFKSVLSKGFCQLNSEGTSKFLRETFWTGTELKIKGLDLFGLKTINISNSTSILICRFFHVYLKAGNVSRIKHLKAVLDLEVIHLQRDKRLPSCHGDRWTDMPDQDQAKALKGEDCFLTSAAGN